MTTSTFSTEPRDVAEPATAAPYEPERPIDTARFWVGTGLTAGISALAAFIALIISDDLLHIPVLIREGGHLVVVGYGAYALIAAAAAAAASVLYTVLLHIAPRPRLYYGWIVGLVTLLAVLLPLIPLTVGTVLATQLAPAGINLVIGLVIICLVPVAVRAR